MGERHIQPVNITVASAERAWDEWGANCGPGTLAGFLGLTFEGVRPHMGNFEEKGYTNPTLMYAALDSLGVHWSKVAPADWPTFGLVRVRWTGPWKYWWERERHTHWIGTAMIGKERGVFDFNALNNGSGWLLLTDWERVFLPWFVGMYDRADGGYEIANGIEVRLATPQDATDSQVQCDCGHCRRFRPPVPEVRTLPDSQAPPRGPQQRGR